MALLKQLFYLVVLGLLLASCTSAPTPAATSSETSDITFVQEDDTLSASAVDTFNITLRFAANVPQDVRNNARSAAALWEKVITKGSQDTQVTLRPFECSNLTHFSGVIDDLVIYIGIADNGNLLETRVCQARATSLLPIVSFIRLDGVGRSGTRDMFTREFAKAMGLGTLWDLKGVIRGFDTANPTFIGANALREYRALGGKGGIPIEAKDFVSTPNGTVLVQPKSYWSEKLGNELFTTVLNDKNFLSRITIGAMQDLGYKVNYALAQPYTLPR